MKQKLATILICPSCRSSLKLDVDKKLKNRIVRGNLKCSKCNSRFKIVDSIVCFKPTSTKSKKMPVAFKKELKKEWVAHYSKEELRALKEEWKWMIIKLNLKQSKIHLDWATGTGRFLREILNRVKGEIVALDADYATCAWLVKFLKQIGRYSKVSVICGDAREMPFQNDAFDSISTWHGLDEPNINKALEESKRVLKRNGNMAVGGFFVKEGQKSLKLAAKAKMDFVKNDRALGVFRELGFKDIDYHLFFQGIWSEKESFLPRLGDKYITYGISGRK